MALAITLIERTPTSMLTKSDSSHRITPHGKFFSRTGQKFFFKAMRLADVSGTLDFGQKLKLRKRLDNLRAAHTTGLVLTEAQSQPCLDIAAQSGLVAMVELRITADELTSRRGWKSVVSRIAHTAHIFGMHSALAGYILDCEIEQDALRAGGLENARRRVRSVVKTIKERAPKRSSASRSVRKRAHSQSSKKIFSTRKFPHSRRSRFAISSSPCTTLRKRGRS